MIDRSKCEGCHLQDQEPVDTKTSGDNPGYMIVTEAPAAYNAQRGRLLSNNASKVLSRELASLGFDKDDFLFVPQIRCVFDPDTLPSKTKALIQKQCRAHLLDTIKEHRPDVIIPLGAEPSKQVHGRAVKITKVRGQAEYSEEHDAVVIPLLHPGYVAMYPQHYSVFKADCNTFARVVDNNLDIEAASNINTEDYHIITDLQFLIDMEPSLIFFDTETTGLEFFHKGPDNVRDYDPGIHGREFNPSAAILTMQFCVKPGTAYMLIWDHPEKPISLRNKAKTKRQLVQLFGRKKTRVIGQNCVTPDTEVLTPEGWINIAEYDGQEIMQWCPDTDRLSFVTPSEYHVHDYSGIMHEWDSHMFSGCFTPNHKMFISQAGSKYDFYPAYAYSVGNVNANGTYVPLSGRHVPESPLDVSENEARLLEAVRADGSVHRGYIRFHFSKSRKVARIVELLELLDMRYSLTTSKTGTTRLYVSQCDISRKVLGLLGPDKTYGPWVLELSISSRLALLDEVQFWDATPHQQSATGVGVYSASENDMSWLQILAHTTNHRMTYSGAPNTRGWSKDDGYIYAGTLNRIPVAKVQYASKKMVYDGKVYCFTVPTGAFMMRRNGKVSITGNSKFDANFVFETLGIRYEIGGDTLMLAALLDENMISKGQDVLVKHYVTEKAGYADCVALGTEILTADMRKVPAESLRVGDEICAFTHDTSGVRAARRSMQKAVVTGAQILRRSCVKITTKSGRTITVSTGHLMLSKLGHHDQGGGWRWVRADELTVGRVLKPFPWEDAATDYDAGYVSGIIDGEGWLCAGKLRLGIAQRGGVVLENTRRVIKRYGLEIGHSTDSRKDVPVVNITFDGKDCIKALQVFRPLRLLDSAKWEGAGLPTNGMRADEIVDIKYVGLQEVVGLRTTTQTIIANGLLSHNSFNATYDKSRMWEVPIDAMVRYGCGDVDTGFMLYKVLIKKLLEDTLLTSQYRYVSLPGLNTFADVEVNGIEVDDDALQAFQTIMEESVANQYRSLITQVPRSIRKKHIDKGLAFSRSAFLLDILFEHRDGFRLRPKVFTKSTEKLQSDMRVPSVSTKDHLPYFFEECPFTEELATYIKDERLLTTSVKGFKKKYIHDGLVRPTYALWVTVTGRTSCVRGDTPVLTRNGTVRADCISVGDEVWTHAGRWMPVLELFDKPPTAMYSLSIENGEILTVTGQHELLLNSGVWATVDSLLESGEGDAINLQRGYEQSSASVEGSERVPEALTDGAAGSGYVRGESCNSEGYDSPSYTGFGIQQTEGHALPCEQARREKPSIRPRVGVRLRGWARVPDTASGREEILCSPDSGSGVSGPTPLSSTCDYGSTSHRRESQEQPYRQFGYSYRGGPSKDTRKVSASERGLAIEKVERAGVHRVYDFEVAEDHSYLACGVFNHNSENPNGQNFPKRGPNAKAYRRIFIAPRGWVVIEADLSQAELRIAADMANEQTMLRIYREGGDIHKSTALIVMGVSLEEFLALPKEEQKAARQKAKAVNFGFSLAEGQLVLTDVGEVPIESVKDWHKVWDGVEWVSHGGVVECGYQEVITYDGVTGTPDHEVFTEDGRKVPIGVLASEVDKRAIFTSSIVCDGHRVLNCYGVSGEEGAEQKVYRNGLLIVRRASMVIDGQPVTREDYELQMHAEEEVSYRLPCRDSWSEIRCNDTTLQERYPREFAQLQGEGDQSSVRVTREVHKVGLAEVAKGNVQGFGLRQNRQRRALLAREFATRDTQCQHVEQKKTYDLIDAGPRRRFTVSGKLVSNCYGMGWRKFIGYAKTQYGVEFTEQEAQRIREAFFSLYSGLPRWHEQMRAWAREHGYVRSYSGRIRHLPMIYSDDEGVQQEAGRQAINSPVQNFASDLGVIAISRMRKAIDPAYLKPIAFVHDAIYCYAREEYAMWGAETIKYYMESNPLEVMFNRRMKVPIVADVSVGRNFGDTYELEGFTSADEFDVGTLWNEDEKSGILLPKQIAPYKNGARQQHIYCTT